MTDKRIKNWSETTGLSLEEAMKRYWVLFLCDNCGRFTNFSLPKGVRQKGVKVDCPNCGCEGELK